MTSFLSGITGSFSLSAAENPTVAIMEAGYRASNLDVRYLNCEVVPEKLSDAVSGALAMGWLGFNCSLPHKEMILKYLDHLAPSAQLIGAVNTVVIKNGLLTGENTDGKGFVESLTSVGDPKGAHTTIFGAGGAARAIAVELALAGASTITIVNRSVERGENLARHIDANTDADCSFAPWTSGYSIREGSSLVINATSLGFYPNHEHTLDVNFSSFSPGMIVADVVPNPPMTRWLQTAEAAGCVPLTGIGMLVNQARVNAKLWTGETLNAGVMHRALTEALGLA